MSAEKTRLSAAPHDVHVNLTKYKLMMQLLRYSMCEVICVLVLTHTASPFSKLHPKLNPVDLCSF